MKIKASLSLREGTPKACRRSNRLRALILLTLFLFLLPACLLARDAPITTAGSSTVCPGDAVTIPVTVTGFSLVTAITLRMDFDSTLMTYSGYTNLNPALAGMVINVVNVNPNLTKILVVWTSIVPLSLPDSTKFFDLHFTLQTGSPVLTFNNDAGGGGECEYADETGSAMNDIPTSSFYFNGIVTNNTVPPAGTISGKEEVCQGETGVVYSIPPIANATSYIWTVPPGATIVSGATTNVITVDFSMSASSDTITAAGANICGTGLSSSLPVEVIPLPVPGITGSPSECEGSTEILYFTESGMPVYLWDISTGGTIISGQGTAFIRVAWDAPGSQYVTVTYTTLMGCSALTPTLFPVEVRPLPTPPVITYSNDSLLSDYPDGNQWYLNKAAIPGADSAHHIPLEDGYYTARVTQDGCTSDSSNSIYVLITGIHETETSALSIFPNPSNGIFTLTLSYPRTLTPSLTQWCIGAVVQWCRGAVVPWCLYVYNKLGEQVYKQHDLDLSDDFLITIDLQFLPDGLYTVVLTNHEQSITRKIIKH